MAASRTPAKAQASAAAAAPVVVAAPAAKSRSSAWALVAGGSLVAVAGGLLWQAAWSDSQDLQQRLEDSKIPGTSTYALDHTKVDAENSTNARNGAIGATGAAVGLVAAGVGLWWALRSEEAAPQVAVAMTSRGALLQWRF